MRAADASEPFDPTQPDPARDLAQLEGRIVDCFRCPRLVEWREHVAQHKRASFAHETYWGRPVPGFGDPQARLLVVGLAPAAHGANRTGRVFTGDRSGDWLFAAMHRAGFASQPVSIARDDGLRLHGAWVAATVRCAPPDNKPLPAERDNCLPYFAREWELLPQVRVLLCLGGFALDALLRAARLRGLEAPRPRPRFGHQQEFSLADFRVLCSYHPSQQNTFTGRLTRTMLDSVFVRARELCETP